MHSEFLRPPSLSHSLFLARDLEHKILRQISSTAPRSKIVNLSTSGCVLEGISFAPNLERG